MCAGRRGRVSNNNSDQAFGSCDAGAAGAAGAAGVVPVALGCVVGPFDLGCGLARSKPRLPLLLCIIRNMVGQREREKQAVGPLGQGEREGANGRMPRQAAGSSDFPALDRVQFHHSAAASLSLNSALAHSLALPHSLRAPVCVLVASLLVSLRRS